MFASVLIALAMSAHSAQVNKLYSASVPVASQQSKHRDQGFHEAFLQVLVKVSGNKASIDEMNSSGNLGSAGGYVQTFSYHENPAYQRYQDALAQQQEQREALEAEKAKAELTGESSTTLSLDEQIQALESKLAKMQGRSDSEDNQANESNRKDATSEELLVDAAPQPFLLDVSFAETSINKELTRLNTPIWGKTRPSSLIWIVSEQDGERVLWGDGEFVAQDYLEQSSIQRGLPVFLPVADLNDVSAIDMSDIWALFPGAVDKASERYAADAVVMMRVFQSSDERWAASWSIQHREGLENRETQRESLALVLDELLDHAATMLSSRYAVLRTQEEHSDDFEVVISNIDSYADYVMVQRYLESLPPVAETKLKWVQGTQHGYGLTLNGTPEQFFEHIELGKKLRRDEKVLVEDTMLVEDTYSPSLIEQESVEDQLAEGNVLESEERIQQFETQLISSAVPLVWIE